MFFPLAFPVSLPCSSAGEGLGRAVLHHLSCGHSQRPAGHTWHLPGARALFCGLRRACDHFLQWMPVPEREDGVEPSCSLRPLLPAVGCGLSAGSQAPARLRERSGQGCSQSWVSAAFPIRGARGEHREGKTAPVPWASSAASLSPETRKRSVSDLRCAESWVPACSAWPSSRGGFGFFFLCKR